MAGMTSATASAVAEYFAALRAMDAERWVAVFAPDAISHDPLGTPPHHGHEALRRFILSILALWTEVGLTEDFVSISGHSAAIKWTGRGTGRNGAHVTFEGIDCIEVNEAGKIVLVKAFWNPGPVIQAITA